MDDHWPLLVIAVRADEGEVEADGQLEVQLDGCTLVVPPDGILDLNVNLWAVERAISDRKSVV